MLQRLDFSVGDGIADDEWLAFCQMIPSMKSLKSLRISHNVFKSFSQSQTRVLSEALKQNTSLEHCHVFLGFWKEDWVREDRDQSISKMSLPLCFNRAGRRSISNLAMGQSLKPELWPLVLERAAKLEYYDVTDTWGNPGLSSRKPDAVYWLLQELFFPR